MKYYVITYSKVHYPITEEQNNVLKTLKLGSEIELDGCSVKVNNIAEILTEEKYYEAYPDKRPETTPDNFSKYEDVIKNKHVSKRAKELMMQGFLKQRVEVGRTREEAQQDLKDLKNNPFGKMFV